MYEGGSAAMLAVSADARHRRLVVLGELVKRVVNLVVVALAAITFFLVPIGEKTLFEHLRAIFSTPAADELGRDLQKTGQQVAHEVETRAKGSVEKELPGAAKSATSKADAGH